MADYYPVLKRAIASLPTTSGEARRIVYEKARAALVKQLQSYNPPLSPSEVTDQRLALEECIRRVESEVAGAAFGLAGEPPADLPAMATPAASPPPSPAVAAPPPERPRPMVPDRPPPATVQRPDDIVAPPPVAEVQKPLPSVQPRREEPPAPSQPAAPPRPEPKIGAGLSALSKTLRQAEQLGGASSQAVRSARDAIEEEVPAEVPAPTRERIEPGFVEPTTANGRPASEGPAAPEPARAGERPSPAARRARQSATERQAPPARSRANSRSRRPLFIAAAALLVVAVAATAGISQRERLAAFFAGDPAADAPQTPATGEVSADGLEPKIVDRLPQEGEPAPAVAPDALAVTTQPVAPNGEIEVPGGVSGTPGEGNADPAVADPDPAPADAEPVPEAPAVDPAVTETPQTPPAAGGDPVILVAQKAILYEEPVPGSPGARIEGRAVWSVVDEPVLPGEAPVTQVRAIVEVPERGLKLVMSIRRNAEASVPATHIIESKFELPADFDGKAIDSSPTLILKQTEDARGDQLVGAVVKVVDNLFWLALSNGETESTRNIALLRDRQWIDVPIRYTSRRRAILTFEKGGPGDEAIRKALEAWGG